MKKILYLALLGIIFTSCQKEEFEIETNYQFEMTGRTTQDINGYYHVTLNPQEDQQTLHRFGAYVTSVDKWNLPTQVIWRCDAFWYTPDTLGHTYIEIGNVPTGESPWSWENFAVTGYNGMTVPIVNSTSYADPVIDSVFCMMAPIGAMVGDTVTIYGKAYFEEGDIKLEDSINVIFN
jgi:hypothetical protein|tara:strand:+ start:245 stop:778 length:534 start_codon:yes stop_codon:yes gene_type:complete